MAFWFLGLFYCFTLLLLASVCLKATETSFSTFLNRTRIAFEVKLQKTSRSTDFRVPQSICTMFNVMVDAKAQSTKLCSMEMGQEVKIRIFLSQLLKAMPWNFLSHVVSVVDLTFLIECAGEYAGGCSQINLMNINIRHPRHFRSSFCKDCGMHKVSLKLGWCMMTAYIESLTAPWCLHRARCRQHSFCLWLFSVDKHKENRSAKLLLWCF